MLKLTEGWNLNPPLYGPIALLNCTLYPLLTLTFPASSTQGTLNIITLSGSTILSNIPSSIYLGFFSKTGTKEYNTSSAAAKNSLSPGLFFFKSSIKLSTYFFTSILMPPFLCSL